MRLVVHVTPRAGRDETAGWRGTELGVRVSAPPEGGKANDAVCRLLADRLGLPKSAVRVVRGDVSRHKTLEIDTDEAHVHSVLGTPPEALF